LLSFVDHADVDREFYMSLVKAQLSKFEIYILFYYAAMRQRDYAMLLQRYGLLQGVTRQDLILEQDYRLYNANAYGPPPME
jgi:hypothetical protein